VEFAVESNIFVMLLGSLHTGTGLLLPFVDADLWLAAQSACNQP